MNQQDAHNAQPGHLIERTDTMPVLYFSERIGRDFGQPFGGWTGERHDASVFSEEAAKAKLAGPLQQFEPFCKVVAL